MKTTFKFHDAQCVKSALHFISNDVADLRYLNRMLNERAFNVIKKEHLNEFSAHFTEVNIVIRHDWTAELIFHWKNGSIVNQVLEAIRLALGEDEIVEETTDV